MSWTQITESVVASLLAALLIGAATWARASLAQFRQMVARLGAIDGRLEQIDLGLASQSDDATMQRRLIRGTRRRVSDHEKRLQQIERGNHGGETGPDA